jgi:hypothetical protein
MVVAARHNSIINATDTCCRPFSAGSILYARVFRPASCGAVTLNLIRCPLFILLQPFLHQRHARRLRPRASDGRARAAHALPAATLARACTQCRSAAGRQQHVHTQGMSSNIAGCGLQTNIINRKFGNRWVFSLSITVRFQG